MIWCNKYAKTSVPTNGCSVYYNTGADIIRPSVNVFIGSQVLHNNGKADALSRVCIHLNPEFMLVDN